MRPLWADLAAASAVARVGAEIAADAIAQPPAGRATGAVVPADPVAVDQSGRATAHAQGAGSLATFGVGVAVFTRGVADRRLAAARRRPGRPPDHRQYCSRQAAQPRSTRRRETPRVANPRAISSNRVPSIARYLPIRLGANWRHPCCPPLCCAQGAAPVHDAAIGRHLTDADQESLVTLITGLHDMACATDVSREPTSS
jgi:hypothetical protein